MKSINFKCFRRNNLLICKYLSKHGQKQYIEIKMEPSDNNHKNNKKKREKNKYQIDYPNGRRA